MGSAREGIVRQESGRKKGKVRKQRGQGEKKVVENLCQYIFCPLCTTVVFGSNVQRFDQHQPQSVQSVTLLLIQSSQLDWISVWSQCLALTRVDRRGQLQDQRRQTQPLHLGICH